MKVRRVKGRKGDPRFAVTISADDPRVFLDTLARANAAMQDASEAIIALGDAGGSIRFPSDEGIKVWAQLGKRRGSKKGGGR